MQQQITASQQVDALAKQLTELFVKKADAEATVKDFDTRITAIRNVLAGVGIGQQLATEASSQMASPPQEHACDH